jgi:hypothetical protein
MAKLGNILHGQSSRGTLYAAVDPTARFVTPAVKEMRFASLLSPFADEAAARAALEAAGASNIRETSR